MEISKSFAMPKKIDLYMINPTIATNQSDMGKNVRQAAAFQIHLETFPKKV